MESGRFDRRKKGCRWIDSRSLVGYFFSSPPLISSMFDSARDSTWLRWTGRLGATLDLWSVVGHLFFFFSSPLMIVCSRSIRFGCPEVSVSSPDLMVT